jgi:hypothetical protein
VASAVRGPGLGRRLLCRPPPRSPLRAEVKALQADIARLACGVPARMRDLPSRVVVYLLLVGCLFGELGYRQVWRVSANIS